MTAETTMERAWRVPVWVWGVIIVLSLIEPAQHFWLRYAPPEGSAATGLHIPDDAIFLHAMRMFDNGYYSPYATCKAGTANSPAYFALPYLWFYGLLGSVGRAAGLDDFITLGIANGLGVFAYLLVAFHFLREVAPRHATLAFALFTLGGGLGGVSYLVCELTGTRLWPGFEEYFRRYALYELLEGPYVSPVACLARVYYTLSLALGLGGLTAHLRAVRMACSGHLGFAMLLYGAATLLNMRVGVFVAAIAALYFLSADGGWRQCGKALLSVAVPVGLSGCIVTLVMRSSPVMIANHQYSGAMAMWLSPFLSAAVFILLPVLYRMRRAIPALAPLPRCVVLALAGYLCAFLVFFGGYQVYYGNLLVCRDGSVAMAISDWALAGALAGVIAHYCYRPFPASRDPHTWIVLWFMGFLAVSVSGFGRGWFLRFGPQRLMVLIGLPMSILAAQGLDLLRASRFCPARQLTGLIIGCGVASIAVSAAYFQGGLGWGAGGGAFAWAKPGLVTRADRQALDRTPEGRILAPPLAADVLALREGHRVVFGTGSFNLTEQPYGKLEGGVHRFFSDSADDVFRHEFVREWGVDYVYCSDTWRVEPAVLEQLRQAPWLRVRYACGMAVVFEVVDVPKSGESHRGE